MCRSCTILSFPNLRHRISEKLPPELRWQKFFKLALLKRQANQIIKKENSHWSKIGQLIFKSRTRTKDKLRFQNFSKQTNQWSGRCYTNKAVLGNSEKSELQCCIGCWNTKGSCSSKWMAWKKKQNTRTEKCLKNGKSYSIHTNSIKVQQKHLKWRTEHSISLNLKEKESDKK